MWPWVLGSAGLGAALGGIKGYQESGGSLGATLRSAAAGGLLGGVTGKLGGAAGRFASGRMAGALPIEMLAKKQAMGLGLTGVERAMLAAPKVAGGAANIGAQLAGGALLAPAAAASGNLIGQAATGTGKVAEKVTGGLLGLGVGQQQPSGAFDISGAVPGELPVTAAPANVFDVLDPSGRFAAGRMAELKEGDVQLENMKKLAPYLFQASEARSKTEFLRQLASAGVRQNIATAANMLERSQQAAQQMGLNTASQMGAALTSQYQYS